MLETVPGFGPIRSARLVPIVTRSLSTAPTASLSHEAAVLEPLLWMWKDEEELSVLNIGTP